MKVSSGRRERRVSKAWDESASLTLENNFIRAEFLPRWGGRMVSLVRKASGNEFLLTCGAAERSGRPPRYGQKFEDYAPFGFDECVPTVQACSYSTEQGGQVQFPDHGELWTAAWESAAKDGQLSLMARGRRWPYIFWKRIRLEGSDLAIDYEIKNERDRPFRFLWSAHPLLHVEAGARLVLPEEVDRLLVSWSRGDRLGRPGESCAWPMAQQRDGAEDALCVVKPRSAETADKLFTQRLRVGLCALYNPAARESIAFRFDPAIVPYVGLWLCYGGWPAGLPNPCYTVALEPCNGWPDSLAEAVVRGDCGELPPHGSMRWSLRLELREGEPRF